MADGGELLAPALFPAAAGSALPDWLVAATVVLLAMCAAAATVSLIQSRGDR